MTKETKQILDNLSVKASENQKVEETKVMLDNKTIIRWLLDQKPQEFFDDELEGNYFKIFIAGITGKNPYGSVIRSEQPYAVEKVIIESANLGVMKNIVLYDVLCFNSPTELHEIVT